MGKHSAPSRSKNLAVAAAAALALTVGGAGATAAIAGPPEGWGPIIKCESGGNPTIQNKTSTASGLFQFINGTWAAYGGTEFAPTAKQATVEQQYIVAERAYAAEGTRPWNASKSCWAGMTGEVQLKPPTAAAVVKPKTQAVKPIEQYQALPVVVPAEAKYTPGGTGHYEVQPGDTLSQLAEDHDTSVQALVEQNGDIVEHADWIFVGEKLNIAEGLQ